MVKSLLASKYQAFCLQCIILVAHKLWHTDMETWGDRILKLYKKTVRIISLGKYNGNTEPIFKNLNLLNTMDIYTLSHYFQQLPLDPNHTIHNLKTP